MCSNKASLHKKLMMCSKTEMFKFVTFFLQSFDLSFGCLFLKTVDSCGVSFSFNIGETLWFLSLAGLSFFSFFHDPLICL